MAVRSLQNVHYKVTDMARARRFYETALGLEVKFADTDRWVQFSVGGRNFALAGNGEAVDGQNGAVTVFETDELDATLQQVETCGGRVIGRRDMGTHGTVATIADPEGNVVQIYFRPR